MQDMLKSVCELPVFIEWLGNRRKLKAIWLIFYLQNPDEFGMSKTQVEIPALNTIILI